MRPVLKACFNSISEKNTVFFISNNPNRWSQDFYHRCKAYFFSFAPINFSLQSSASFLFKDLTEIVFPFRFIGSIIISNEGKCILGKSFEISISLTPVLMPITRIEYKKIELCLESLIEVDSVLVQYLYGNNWIVSSVASDFFALCEGLRDKNSALICSSDIDLDFGIFSDVPIFYSLFPGITNPTTFLMRKIANKEVIRNIDLPPLCLNPKNTEILEFVWDNFEIEKFEPNNLESGFHRHLFNFLAEKAANFEMVPVKSKLEKKNALETISNSICRKKKKNKN